MNCIAGGLPCGQTARGRQPVTRSTFTLLLALAGATALGACDDERTPTPPTETQAIALDQTSLRIEHGATARLRVLATDAGGSVRELGASAVTWTVLDPMIASVEEGVVSALRPGATRVIATTAGELTATADVVVDTGPGMLDVLDGDMQTGIVGQPLSAPIRVRLVDHDGNPLGGRELELKPLTATSGAVTPQQVTLDDQGFAEFRWTLGELAGPQSLDVLFADRDEIAGVIVAEARAGEIARVDVSPAGVVASPGDTVRFTAVARDRFDNVVPDAQVRWSLSGAKLVRVQADGSALAIAEGDAQVQATVVPMTTGESAASLSSGVTGVTAFASQSGANVPQQVRDLRAPWSATRSVVLRFTEVNDGTGAPANYEIRYKFAGATSGSTQVTKGSCASPVSGSRVGRQFTCEVYGLYSSTGYDFQVVSFRGTQGVDAVYGPASNVVTMWTGLPVSAGRMDIISGNRQSGAAGAELRRPLRVRIRDTNGNPMPGMEVRWSVISGGGRVSSSTTLTNNNGQAEVRWTLGSGTQEVRASLESVSATFTAVSSGGTSGGDPAPTDPVIASVSVSPSSGSVERGQGLQLVARARDASGNTISSARFEWTSANGATAAVSSNGYVTGVSAGSTSIRASAGGRDASAAIQVKEPASDPDPEPEPEPEPTPPPVGSGAWPNEPSGVRVTVDEPFDSKTLRSAVAGPWAYSDAWGTSTIVADNGVVRFRYPSGFAGGSSPGIASNDRTTQNFTGYYIGVTVRCSLPWTSHPSGVNKILYWGETSGVARGGGTSQFVLNRRHNYIDVGLQWGQGYQDLCIPYDSARNIPDCSVKRLATTRVDDGAWHRVELVANASTNGQANGRVRVWVDGVLQFDATNVRWAPSGTARFYGVSISPVWGGVGATKPQTEWIDLDHLRISGW